MSIPRKARFVVLERDGFACRYCGAKAPDVRLHVDHVIPSSKGGTDDPDNLVTACDDCNMGKGSMLLSDCPDEVREAAEAAFDRAETVRELVREAKEQTGVTGAPVDAPEAVLKQITSDGHALSVSIAASMATQSFVASAVGVSESYLSYMKVDVRRIPEKLVGPLCAATGTNLLRQYRDRQIAEAMEGDVVRLAALVRSATA